MGDSPEVVYESETLGRELTAKLAEGCVRHYPFCPLADKRFPRLARSKLPGVLPVMYRDPLGVSHLVGEWVGNVVWITVCGTQWVAAKLIVRDTDNWPRRDQKCEVAFTPAGVLFRADAVATVHGEDAHVATN